MIIERRVLHECIRGYGLVEMLTVISWQNILSWGGSAYPSVVERLYDSITDFDLDALSFTIKVGSAVKTFNPLLIAALLKVPRYPHSDGRISHVSEVGRRNITIFLCRNEAPWKNNNALQMSLLFPQFRVLHGVCTSNVYPRKGNKTEFTPCMANILYHVGTGKLTCLPSLICSHSIQFVMHRGHSAHPLGHLMSKIASLLRLPLPEREMEIVPPFNIFNLNRMKLTPLSHQAKYVY